jgi:hypothetical protein
VEEKQQVPPLRYASVGMTHFLQGKCPKTARGMDLNSPTELSSRPERSEAEGPAVSLPVLTHSLKPRPLLGPNGSVVPAGPSCGCGFHSDSKTLMSRLDSAV